MNNPRMTVKERNLLKGAMRRVFARSDLRKQVVSKIIVQHSDPKRKRVKTWGKCPCCGELDAISNFQVDHIIPLIELDKTLEDYTWDELIDRLWCEIDNLKPIRTSCHKIKSKAEAAIRAKHRREKKLKEKKK